MSGHASDNGRSQQLQHRSQIQLLNAKSVVQESSIKPCEKDTNELAEGLENVLESLVVISAMSLPEALEVVDGDVIQECLLGQVKLASFSLGNHLLPLVVKEFDLTRVLNKTTKNGRRVNESALSELRIHAYIKDKQIRNVIGLYGMHFNIKANKLRAYFEYAEKGDLFSIMRTNGTTGLLLPVCGNFFVQLLNGIDALHSINVVHRDLSLENLLFTQDNEIKICDFGLAAICAPGQTIRDGRAIGKVSYMCPELYYHEEYNPRMVDIWSAGVILFIMLTGIFPYESPSVKDPRLVMMCHGEINEMLAQWQRPSLEQDVLQVFSKIFCPPQQRWSAEQLLRLPFCQRFANVSKAATDAALAHGDANGMQSNSKPADDSTPSPCAAPKFHSNNSNGTTKSLQQLENPSPPIAPVPASTFTNSKSLSSLCLPVRSGLQARVHSGRH